MNMKDLITIEAKKISLKKIMKQVFWANIFIFLLTIILPFSGEDLETLSLATVIDTLIKATFIIWEALLIAQLIVEEFRSKTILLLFSYPIDRKKILISKLIFIGFLVLCAMTFSQIVQHLLFFILGKTFPMISYSISLTNIVLYGFTTITSILIGLIPFYIGMLNKSTNITIISAIAVVSLTASSGADGSSAMTIIPITVSLAILGLIFTYFGIKKNTSGDILV